MLDLKMFGGGVFGEEKDFQLYVAHGTYEQVTNWINNKIEGKDEK